MSQGIFDIFSGFPNDNPVWLETVDGLSDARVRMNQIASQKPGRYFIFCIGTHSPVAKMDTLAKGRSENIRA